VDAAQQEAVTVVQPGKSSDDSVHTSLLGTIMKIAIAQLTKLRRAGWMSWDVRAERTAAGSERHNAATKPTRMTAARVFLWASWAAAGPCVVGRSGESKRFMFVDGGTLTANCDRSSTRNGERARASCHASDVKNGKGFTSHSIGKGF